MAAADDVFGVNLFCVFFCYMISSVGSGIKSYQFLVIFLILICDLLNTNKID